MASAAQVNWSLISVARFFLAFVVVNHHIGFFHPSHFSSAVAMFGGKAAVVGFLVISGYSVSASFDKAPHGFLFRRFLRIYPAYFFAILAAVLLQTVVGHYSIPGMDFSPSGPGTILGNLLMLQCYVVRRIDFDPVVWSLSIEFSYYILTPYLSRLPGWVRVATLLGSGAFFLLPLGLSHGGFYQALMKLNMVRCLWPFLVGALLQRHSDKHWFLLAASLGTLMIFVSDWTPEILSPASYFIAIVAIYFASRNFGRQMPALDYLGDVSYPLYLVHLPLMIAFAALAGITNPWVLTAASLAAAVVVMTTIEIPFRAQLAKLGSLRILSERTSLNAEQQLKAPS